MTDKPQNRLSLKPKISTTESGETATPTTRRGKKRIIRRDELPAAKLTKTKAPPPKPAKKKPKSAAPTKPTISRSDIRLDNLNASLNAFEAWRNYQPLAIGIEKQVFQHIAKHQLSASKRVVQLLLRQHTRDERYLRAVRVGNTRFDLDGTGNARTNITTNIRDEL